MNAREIMEELGVPYKTHEQSRKVRPGWIGTRCPFCGHGGDEGYLGFPVNGRAATCWTCGRHRLGDALAALTGLTISRLMPLIREMAPDPLPGDKTAPRGRYCEPWGLGPLLPAHTAYLSRRGLDPDETVRLYGLRGLGVAGPLSWRIWFPLLRDMRPVSWATRSISDAEPAARFRSASPAEEAYPHRDLLFGEDLAAGRVLVVEGFFDAMAVGPGAVATMGVQFTRPQVCRIARFPDRAVCFDSEPAAREMARRLCYELEPFPGRTRRVELDSHDPGSASKKEVRRLRRHFLD